MGNKLCCFVQPAPESKNKAYKGLCLNVKRRGKTLKDGNFKKLDYIHIQHISEREPDDIYKDPSSNPITGPLFISKCGSDKSIVISKRRQLKKSESYSRHYDGNKISDGDADFLIKPSNSSSKSSVVNDIRSRRFKNSIVRCNSTSTIFIDDCTVSQPNLKMVVKSLALAILYHIQSEPKNERILDPYSKRHLQLAKFLESSESLQNTLSNSSTHNLKSNDQPTNMEKMSSAQNKQSVSPCRCTTLKQMHKSYSSTGTNNSQIFDEKVHPLNKDKYGDCGDIKDPDFKTIYKFLRNLFTNAQLTAECAVITLVYLERLLTYAEDIILKPNTWRRIVLGAIILASKVWDDQAVWNVDYCQILKEVPVDDVNELEKEFLELLQFNINVPSSVYAKYYFELRLLAENNEMLSRTKLLDMKRARKLEAISRFENDIPYKLTHEMIEKRKCLSTECLLQPGKASRAIIS